MTQLAQLPADTTGPGETFDARDALLRLSPQDREILLLVAWEGLAGPALAVACGCSAPTARVWLHRARQRLQRELDRDLDMPDVASPPSPGTTCPSERHPFRPEEVTHER